MLNRFVFIFLIVASCTALRVPPGCAQDRHPAPAAASGIPALLAELRATTRDRDSLTTLADQAAGTSRDFLEEQIWQRHVAIHAGLLALVDRIKSEQARGVDVTEYRTSVSAAVREEWPRFLAQLKRRDQELGALNRAADSASGAARVSIEAEMTERAERLVEAYQSVVDAVLALDKIGIEVSDQRAYLLHALPAASDAMITRLQLVSRDRSSAGLRLSRDAANADLRYAFEANDERLKRATHTQSAAIELLDRLGIPNTRYKVALIAATGRVNAYVFDWPVLLGLGRALWARFVDFLSVKGPQWLFQSLLIVLTFLAFRTLAGLVRGAVTRAVRYSHFSELMRGTLVRLSGHAVTLIGFVVILTQLGVQVAPLLAGLGIAGFVIGFAMQNTLSNFAAGGMILGNQPFDIGDEIEVAGVIGIVKKMSLVSTTVLTPDNQTLIIPNSTVWGGIIRNRTAQPTRRVDLTFGIGYQDDVEKAERVLREVVQGQKDVLKEPEPVIKLDKLADSSVNFVVRVWTKKERYNDVNWDITRAVKLRFDQEGITIPFPQRELHLNVEKGGAEVPAVALGATAAES